MLFIFKQILKGKSVTRSFSNNEVHNIRVHGDVADIGSGSNPYYYKFFQNVENATFHSMDKKIGDDIDFETDNLPFEDNSFDMVLSMSVLEHIYNHTHLLGEMVRILKPGGECIIYVPFFIYYHPDPKDFFRYTKDALNRMTNDAGLKNVRVKEVGMGLFVVGVSVLIPSLPRVLRPFVFLPAVFLDWILLKIKKRYHEQFPLGYMVYAKK